MSAIVQMSVNLNALIHIFKGWRANSTEFSEHCSTRSGVSHLLWE